MCHKLDQVIIFAGSWQIETYLGLIIGHEDILGSQKHHVWRQEFHCEVRIFPHVAEVRGTVKLIRLADRLAGGLG